MFRRCTAAVVTILACAEATGAESALGHGPCRCLSPASGPPGTVVTAAYPSYKVVFNPDRTDLSIGPESLWRDHRPAIPPTVVFRKTYRYADLPLRGPVQFRIPQSPPGPYLVSLYDGSEGGVHYSWETFEVTEHVEAIAGRPPTQSRNRTPDSAGIPTTATVLLSVSTLLVGVLLGGLIAGRKRRRADASP